MLLARPVDFHQSLRLFAPESLSPDVKTMRSHRSI
jgi:hypothetical protein